MTLTLDTAIGMVRPAWRSAPGYTLTLGPIVADLCARAGYPPDPEQELGLDMLFALRQTPRGPRSAAFEFGLVAPRQNLKTGLVKQAALGWLFITQVQDVTWTAHLFDTAREAHRDLSQIITAEGNGFLSSRLAPGPSHGIATARGAEAIELASGQRIKYKARSENAGRGLSGDKVVLDEAFALTPDMMGALLPTLTTRPDPQVIYASSAGQPGSDVLREIRDRGRTGISRRLAYLEWAAHKRPCEDARCTHAKPGSADWRPGCQLDNIENWHMANSLLGRTRPNGSGFPVELMHDFRSAEPPDQFARERLGWWADIGGDLLFGAGAWDRCYLDPAKVADAPRPRALGVAVSVDLTWSAIVAATLVEVDGVERRLIKPLRHGAGTDWVFADAVELSEQHEAPVVLDAGGPAAFLAKRFQKRLYGYTGTDMRKYADACAELYVGVGDREVAHSRWPELEEAITAATRRPLGDRWAWGRRGNADISTLEAATLALWGIDNAKAAVSSADYDSVMV